MLGTDAWETRFLIACYLDTTLCLEKPSPLSPRTGRPITRYGGLIDSEFIIGRVSHGPGSARGRGTLEGSWATVWRLDNFLCLLTILTLCHHGPVIV